MYFAPEDFGLARGSVTDLSGGDKDENARIALDVLKGEKGHRRDIVLINSAAALTVSGKVSSFSEAFDVARETVDSGLSMAKLEEVRKITRKL
jgi:anthranilate phosphoribosyltransferase